MGLTQAVGHVARRAHAQPGLSSLTLRAGLVAENFLPEGDGFTDPDAISLVAALARLPVGQTRTNAEPISRGWRLPWKKVNRLIHS